MARRSIELYEYCQRPEVQPRAVAERLAFLGCVDPGQADFVLLEAGVEQGDGVAVGDRDDAAGEFVSAAGLQAPQREKGRSSGPSHPFHLRRSISSHFSFHIRSLTRLRSSCR